MPPLVKRKLIPFAQSDFLLPENQERVFHIVLSLVSFVSKSHFVQTQGMSRDEYLSQLKESFSFGLRRFSGEHEEKILSILEKMIELSVANRESVNALVARVNLVFHSIAEKISDDAEVQGNILSYILNVLGVKERGEEADLNPLNLSLDALREDREDQRRIFDLANFMSEKAQISMKKTLGFIFAYMSSTAFKDLSRQEKSDWLNLMTTLTGRGGSQAIFLWFTRHWLRFMSG